MTTPQDRVRIRAMTLEDLDSAVAIAHSLKNAPHWPPEAYCAGLVPHISPRRIMFVAEETGTGILGFAVAALIPPQAELETIAVVASFQRRGVARRIFAALAAKLRNLHVTEVILEVRPSNLSALALYRSLGFVQSGRRPRYYADPQEDAVLMSLRFG